MLDKEVMKKKQVDGPEDFRKAVEVRLHDLVDKFSLPNREFDAVFVLDTADETHGNSVHHENKIQTSEWVEPESEVLWQRALTMGHLKNDDLDQLRSDLERLDHRLSKRRYLERQLDEDKKNEDVKRRLKEVKYKSDKQKKELENRYFLDHTEL